MLISIHIVFFLFLHCFLYYYYLTNLHTVCVNKHTYIIFRFCTERCDPPHERCRRQPATGMGNSRIGSIRRGLCSKCLYISDDLPQPDGVMPCPKRRHTSPGRGPPNGRRRHRHLEGGNGRIGSTRRGCSCRFGPECCSQVSLCADLTQPGGEAHWSKHVCGKSKG